MVCVGQDGAKTRFQTLTPKKKGKKLGILSTKEHGNNMCEMSMKVMIRNR